MLSPVFAQNSDQVLPTENEILKVGFSTIRVKPIPDEKTKFKIEFINQKTVKIQVHIDYKFTLQRDGKNVFGPTNLIHTSEGSVIIPVLTLDAGTYSAIIEIEGILFQPIPVEVVSFSFPIVYAEAPDNGTKENGGGCLIATATFDSELSPQVQQLRELRDNILLQTSTGSTFMTGFNQFYYSFSPTIADWERQNPVFKEAVKLTITPLITSLSLLNYVDIDSEEEMLGYGLSLILLNVGMYFALPAIAITKWYNLRR